MAGKIKVYHAVDLVVNGEQQPGSGSMVSPIKEASLTTALRRIPGRRILVPADTKMTIWQWSDTNGFDYLSLIVRGSGYLRVAWRVEPVTSETNQTPTGASKMWHHRSLSCIAPLVMDTDRVYHDSTASNVVGDSLDLPTLWSAGTKVNGVISRIAVWNEDTEDPVECELYVVGD